MKFCNYEECPHYSKATKYPSKCYYGEPMCLKGWLDLIFLVIVLRFRRDESARRSKPKR